MSKWRRFAGIYTAPSRELIYGTKYAENVYVRTLALLPYALTSGGLPELLGYANSLKFTYTRAMVHCVWCYVKMRMVTSLILGGSFI